MQPKQRPATEQRKRDFREAWTVLCGFLCTVLLSRVCIRGAHIPLALGLLLGCALSGIETYGILGGVVLGALIHSPPLWQSILSAVAFTASMRVVLWMKKPCRPGLILLLFGASGVVSLPLLLLFGAAELLYGALSLVGAFAFGVCIRHVIRSIQTAQNERLWTDTEQTMLILALSAILISAQEAQMFGWSLSVSLLLVLTAAYVSVRGVFGAAAGTLWASLLVLYTGAEPAMIGCVACGALLGAALRRYGKPLMISAFFLSAIVFRSILSEPALSVNLQNLLCSMLLFILLPRAWTERLKAMTDTDAVLEQTARSTIERIEYGVSEELLRMGRLLSGCCGFAHLPATEDDTARLWTAQGALAICQNCEKRPACWKNAEAMQEAICRLAEDADNDRSVKPIEPMDPVCRRFRDLTAAVSVTYQLAKNRDAVLTHAKEQAGWIDRQFRGVGDALIGYAKRMRSRDRDAEVLCKHIRDALCATGVGVVSVDRYESDEAEILSVCLRLPLQMKKKELRRILERASGESLRLVHREIDQQTVTFIYERDARLHASMRVFRSQELDTVSGDATGECRLIGGNVCFALSDGMGSGENARQESEAAIDLLFRLYHAGMHRDLVYDSVNRLLLARNEEEMYATLDAVSIDLHSGDAELLKYGAPPSYLIRNGRVRPIAGEALPCGILAEAKPSVIRLKLRPNDRLVLCSDGVQDMLNDQAEETIRSVAGENDAMGELLLNLAKSRGGSDDMTVMVIRVA